MEKWKLDLMEDYDVKETILFDIVKANIEVLNFKLSMKQIDYDEYIALLSNLENYELLLHKIPLEHPVRGKYKHVTRRSLDDRWITVGFRSSLEDGKRILFYGNQSLISRIIKETVQVFKRKE